MPGGHAGQRSLVVAHLETAELQPVRGGDLDHALARPDHTLPRQPARDRQRDAGVRARTGSLTGSCPAHRRRSPGPRTRGLTGD